MNKRLQAGALITVAAAAGFAGWHFNRAHPHSPTANTAVQKLLLLRLADLGGKAQTLSRQRGKIPVVNFWATWCLPCRKEIPLLKKTHQKYAANGVEIVGIADDNVSKVREFSSEIDIDYGVLVGGAEALAASGDLGNRAEVLPYTVILDQTRRVAYTYAGALSEAALDAELTQIL